ncbi:hypothetical protein OG528_07925 [Streptomyces platensis]|jgi:hypothetical protein
MSMRVGPGCRTVAVPQPAGAGTSRNVTPTDRHTAPQGATS